MLPEALHRRGTIVPISGPAFSRIGPLRADAGTLVWIFLPPLLVPVLLHAPWRTALGAAPLLVLAFWAAVYDFLRREGSHGDHGFRLALGLGLGVLFAHLGWMLIHPRLVASDPHLLLEARGFSSYFLPLGVLTTAPRRGDRLLYLARAVGCLALGLAVARLGCIVAGCCRGAPTYAFFAVGGRYPTRWLEWAGLVGLCLGSRRLPLRLVAPLTLAGYGALRLTLAPLREADPAGPDLLAPAWLAAVWLLFGSGWALRESIRSSNPFTRTAS